MWLCGSNMKYNQVIKRKRPGSEHNNNRLHTIMAIIFLLGGGVIFRLFNLQVMKYDYYTAIASDQHNVFSQLEPQRGEIYIQDDPMISGSDIYPIATNKDFAHVYAVPRDIVDADAVSNQLYEIFDKEEVQKEVEMMFRRERRKIDDSATSTIASTTDEVAEMDDEIEEELRQMKIEKEIETKKQTILLAYKEKLSKKNDPYEPIRRKVDEAQLEQVKKIGSKGLGYTMESFRYYPERNIGSHILGFVGYNEEKQHGIYGLEGFFDEILKGEAGSIRADRAADGELIIINDREYQKAKNGSNLILTINRSIQFTACNKLQEAIGKYQVDGGTVVVMQPQTGAILAMCSWPDYDPNNYGDVSDANVYNNPAIFNSYEPGSIFKAMTVAIGIDQGKISPTTLYNDNGFVMIEGWNKPIKNSDFQTRGGHGTVDMNTVLEQSLNTGTIFILNQVGDEVFADYTRKFGFGEKTGIELETEGTTNIENLNRKQKRHVEMATASFGQGITVTPLQMAAAYSVIANGGILMKPYLVNEIVGPDGEKLKTRPIQIRRVISERTALAVSGMLVNVVEKGHSKRAKIDGYYIAGKTGTAQVADSQGGYGHQTIHTFAGFAPADDPKFVMIVRLDNPKNAIYAESTAAPLFEELTSFIINYYKIPKER